MPALPVPRSIGPLSLCDDGQTGGSRAEQASRVALRDLATPTATVLDFLSAYFPRVSDWSSRVERGLVRTEGGALVDAATPYRAGLVVLYYREVSNEPPVPFDAKILYQDANLLVADKPPFLPVVPAGKYVRETLLARIQRDTGLESLVPLHRLDRETAGLVLFAVNPAARGMLHGLFSSGRITKVYEAVAASVSEPHERTWHVENRIERGEPFCRMRITEGPPNACSDIRLLAQRDGRARFEIRPKTGKTHQIRLHLASIGFPILHDRFYPVLEPEAPPDFARPLQLVARRLEFVDPITGASRTFETEQKLAFAF